MNRSLHSPYLSLWNSSVQRIRPRRSPLTTDILPRPTDVRYNFTDNPLVVTTALAHSLWSYILRPGVDSAIDATCGNGNDSLAMAKLLFSDPTIAESHSELVAVDVHEEAIENTRCMLSTFLDSSAMDGRVRLCRQSHAPLPLPRITNSIGLVAYNLGYFRSAKNPAKDVQTETESTLLSLNDAVRAIRVGGLISVITYPMSNSEEAAAVKDFLRGLPGASLKSKQPSGALWRVYEHRGVETAPILWTATRLQ